MSNWLPQFVWGKNEAPHWICTFYCFVSASTISITLIAQQRRWPKEMLNSSNFAVVQVHRSGEQPEESRASHMGCLCRIPLHCLICSGKWMSLRIWETAKVALCLLLSTRTFAKHWAWPWQWTLETVSRTFVRNWSSYNVATLFTGLSPLAHIASFQPDVLRWTCQSGWANKCNGKARFVPWFSSQLIQLHLVVEWKCFGRAGTVTLELQLL